MADIMEFGKYYKSKISMYLYISYICTYAYAYVRMHTYFNTYLHTLLYYNVTSIKRKKGAGGWGCGTIVK
jgi:hypothetical protein